MPARHCCGTDATAPYSFTWANVPSGVHSLTARAVDVYGAAATSAAISITVNTGPSVALTSPASGSTYAGPASIAMSATASDSDGTVERVEFYAGTSLLSTDTTAPYAFTWSPGGYGVFSLTAQAVDSRGARTISNAATVTVARLATSVAAAPASVVTGQPSTITVSGSPVCGGIEINYGDGTARLRDHRSSIQPDAYLEHGWFQDDHGDGAWRLWRPGHHIPDRHSQFTTFGEPDHACIRCGATRLATR